MQTVESLRVFFGGGGCSKLLQIYKLKKNRSNISLSKSREEFYLKERI